MNLSSRLQRSDKRNHNHFRSSRSMTIILGLMAAFMIISIVLFPAQAFNASIHGLNIWWKFVFPSLLPVLILSELMIGYGILHGIGTLIDPLLHRMFRLPYQSGIAICMSLAAGFPRGARATADLRQQECISREEADRLLALSHVASPVLIITIIGVGFLGSIRLGFMLAIIYYSSYAVTGFIMRLFPSRIFKHDPSSMNKTLNGNAIRSTLISRIKQAMHDSYREKGKTFGKMMGDAVIDSIQNLMVLGGYIIIFSVISALIKLTSIDQLLQSAHWIAGILEIHLGTYNLSQAGRPMIWSIVLMSTALGWSGISSFFQVKSMIYQTDISMLYFGISRIIHAVCALGLTFLLWKPVHLLFDLELLSRIFLS